MKRVFLLTAILFMCIYTYTQEIHVHANCMRKSVKSRNAHIAEKTPPTDFDITKYVLKINANPLSDSFSGTSTVLLTALDDIDKITLDAQENLDIGAIYYFDQPLTTSFREGQKLIINLPTTIKKGEKGEVSVSFSGKESDSEAYNIKFHNGIPNAYTKAEPSASSGWWVCRDNLSDKADEIEIHITHPSEFKAAANGKLISETVNNDGTTTTLWQHQYPITPYLVGISVTNYEVYTNYATIGDTEMPIINYVYPESLESAKATLDNVPTVIQLFNNLFGDYPYKNEKYGHAQWLWSGGMEHATISFMKNFSQGLINHELMHQWFGDKVTCATWNDIWLNEGFATYGEGLFYEHLLGEEDFTDWKGRSINGIIGNCKEGSVYNPMPEDEDRTFDSNLSYTKASMVVHMLRKKLGDEAFYSGIKNYLNSPELAYGFATTEDLKTCLQNSSGADLDEFFNDWVYGEGYPLFDIQVNQQLSGKTVVKINQKTTHNSVDFFETPFSIQFFGSNSETITKHFDLTENNQSFETDIPFTIKEIKFNPTHDIIASIEAIHIGNINLTGYNELSVYPNPARDYINLTASSPIESASIYDLSGKLLISTSSINNISTSLNIVPLPQGSYILKVRMANNNNIAFKVLKL
ncbi:M1 family aminopeptidase [Dysgonomonas sp. 520]|uniref:M1 family aminopeptidase n=1 Tax=Dysgonomonas sp. 520 TaxID=2302931 RepID=UPI0013D6DEBA|nr:M1 family aminopeptidase [Dysgonomonas sp. 520]NDW09910.1 T9SS C-terminal target domain-containing protein [Dysgonomonas sp. 520]